jgi:nitrate/TMAO reductase-like tetraheme cytochrome c subunit
MRINLPLEKGDWMRRNPMKKALILFGMVLAFAVLVAAKYDNLLETGDKTAKSSECNECHKVIYEEWLKDGHARAYSHDSFKKASQNHTDETCLPCHAAQENGEEKNLKLRPVNREEGINCATCHLRNHMIYGPYKLTAKHKSDQDESLLKSGFCAGCHSPTYQEWQASGSKKTCQECHMPRTEGKLVQGFLLSMVVPKRMMGQHVMIFEGLLKEAALVAGEAGKGTVSVMVTNKGADHLIPTGEYGDYRVVLKTQVRDGEGKTVLLKEEVFSNLKKSGIPPQKTVTFEYPVSFETGKRYKVTAGLFYQVEGKAEQSMATWNAEIEGK